MCYYFTSLTFCTCLGEGISLTRPTTANLSQWPIVICTGFLFGMSLVDQTEQTMNNAERKMRPHEQYTRIEAIVRDVVNNISYNILGAMRLRYIFVPYAPFVSAL